MNGQWVRTAYVEGRVIGEFESQDEPPRSMVVIKTLEGEAVAPRDGLIPIDQDYFVGSLSHRIEDVLVAARQAGLSTELIAEAIRWAMNRQDVSFNG